MIKIQDKYEFHPEKIDEMKEAINEFIDKVVAMDNEDKQEYYILSACIVCAKTATSFVKEACNQSKEGFRDIAETLLNFSNIIETIVKKKE